MRQLITQRAAEVALIALLLCASLLRGQDVVIASSAADPAARIKRSGTILDYTGTELRLRTPLGIEETIPSARVVEMQTRWSPAHEAGRLARGEGRLDDAIAALRQAKREDSRSWAVRQIMAELTGCYLDAGQIDRAGDEFLGIIASDSRTRHFDAIPIAWRGVALSRAVEARASAWLAARDNPVARLLGASWLLATQRPAAIAALETLTKSTDPRIVGLATIQLWRTKLVTATADDAHRWQSQLETLPSDVQASGWYVLGDLLVRQAQPAAAVLAYLKPAVLFRQQRLLAAEALLAAGTQLEKMARTSEALALYRELARDYPGLWAAREAESRLTLQKNG